MKFNIIPFCISKVSSSFCQLDFTVINTSAPSAPLFDCLLLYVKCKCQSNFLQAYLHDNKLETNRWQLTEITGEHLGLSRFRRDMKGRPCTQPCLFSHVHTVTRGGNRFNFDHEKCQTEVIKEFTIQFAYKRITLLNPTATTDRRDIQTFDPTSLRQSSQVFILQRPQIVAATSPSYFCISEWLLLILTPQHSYI